MFIGKWNPSVILTYIGVGFSLAGIFLILSERREYAISCLIMAGICDLFDGKLARSMKRNKEEEEFGIQLDSLADVLSFVVFPVIILLGLEKGNLFSLFSAFVFAICGIARLAFFNILASSEEAGSFFRGLPVTYTALALPLIYLLRYVLPEEVFVLIFQLSFLGIGFFNILDIKIRKPRGAAYIIFPLLALAMLWFYGRMAG
ncbi:MAG: CDP-alcohol phosphatidyltransferase family protein [Johnsonella sp.]|nr:CDP-alcohol phosphatidyltransferase family protein [Johnsonella sp.]